MQATLKLKSEWWPHDRLDLLLSSLVELGLRGWLAPDGLVLRGSPEAFEKLNVGFGLCWREDYAERVFCGQRCPQCK